MLTNKYNLPEPFVNAVKGNHEYTPKRYSVTEVLGGTCEAILKRRHQGEQDEDVSDRVWALFGTVAHKVLQEAEATETQLQENWISVPISNGYTLSGIFDLYDDATGTVTDWKTTSVWTVQLRSYDNWRKQCLIYCWMLQQLGFQAWRGEIVAILRDHSQRKARTEKDYPRHPIFKIGWDFTKSDLEEIGKEIDDWFRRVEIEEAFADVDLMPCNAEQRWHKPDTWAVMRSGRKRAVRVFQSEEQAVELCNQMKETDKGCYIEFRQGEDTKCQGYCPVCDFCPWTKKAENPA